MREIKAYVFSALTRRRMHEKYCEQLNSFRENQMQWYYKWKLKKIQKEISILEVLASHPLIDDFTAKSRLRTLSRLAAHFQERLAHDSPSVQH